MVTSTELSPYKYRSIWISDVHLGYKGCKAEYLLDFLRSSESEYLFLVGDIVDLWSMKNVMFWPQSHNNIIRTLLGKAKHGTKVMYIPGNHDDPLREHVGNIFGNIEIKQQHIHKTVNNKSLLILHGDEFDGYLQCNFIAKFLGNKGYDLLLVLNRWLFQARKILGFPYWSLSSHIKTRVKNAMAHIHQFEQAAVQAAKHHNVDGIICGHIHHPDMKDCDGILYCNDGDWVENCSTLVEYHDGSLELLHWSDIQHGIKSTSILHKNTAPKPSSTAA